MLLARLDGFASELAEQMFASSAGEIDHEPERFRLATARMFENFAGGIYAELRANGTNIEGLETFITLGVSHTRLKFETRWDELTAATPPVRDGVKN